ncbi:MAG: hypothetical protein MI976_11750 [Pseudomonadales bacterium]|nr:hypothetical protein [Pseudomonadales bacterium]
MNEQHRKSGLKQEDKRNLLSDLEDLSGMLDDDGAKIEPELTQPYDLEDLPVLKSFVEDVPTLNESMSEASKDKEAGTTQEQRVDDSFVDDDPLAISSAVRHQHSHSTASDATPSNPTSTDIDNVPTLDPLASPLIGSSGVSNNTAATAPPTPSLQPKGDNPFLPKNTLDRLRNEASEVAESTVSQELRNLVKQRALPNFDTNSKEYQALRNQASKMVNEVIKSVLPRLEAELRMKLENEVDAYLKELRKNAQD